MVVTDNLARNYDAYTTDSVSCCSDNPFYISVGPSASTALIYDIRGAYSFRYWAYDRGFHTLKEARDYQSKLESQWEIMRLEENFQLPRISRRLPKRQVFRPKNMSSQGQREYQKRKSRLHNM